MRDRIRFSDERGTTLIELVITAAIFIVLLGAALQMLDTGTRSERAQQSRHDALVELRTAVSRVTKDARQALEIAPASTRTRLEMITLVGGAQHQVTYELVGGEVRRSIDGGAPATIATNVTVAQPFCYDPPDCVAAAPAQPTMIRVTLALTPDVLSGGPITLATDIQLRNS